MIFPLVAGYIPYFDRDILILAGSIQPELPNYLACVGVRCLAFASACAQSWAAVSGLYDLCQKQVATIIIIVIRNIS